MKKYVLIIILIISTIISTPFQCFGHWKKYNGPTQGEYTADQCPKCGSTHIQITQKNFNGWGALGGAILLGPIGLAAGAINMGDAKFVCIKCGFDFDHEDIELWNKQLKKGYIQHGIKYTPQQLKQIRDNQKE